MLKASVDHDFNTHGNEINKPKSFVTKISNARPPYPTDIKFIKPFGVIETKYLKVFAFWNKDHDSFTGSLGISISISKQSMTLVEL